jgi:hypothetical protein
MLANGSKYAIINGNQVRSKKIKCPVSFFLKRFDLDQNDQMGQAVFVRRFFRFLWAVECTQNVPLATKILIDSWIVVGAVASVGHQLNAQQNRELGRTMLVLQKYLM